MAWTLAEVSIQKVINNGMRNLRSNKPAFLEIFDHYTEDEMNGDYGAAYIEKIWDWFSTTKIPVIQAWSFNPQSIPAITVHLANEQEAEDKIALDDYAGSFDDVSNTGTAAFTVMLDIGIHANKSGDHVLWLYYIVAYILFKYKLDLDRLGLKMGTFSASDYSRDAEKMGNNVWTRWVRYRCTTQNFWSADALTQIDVINLDSTDSNAGLLVSRISGDGEDLDV